MKPIFLIFLASIFGCQDENKQFKDYMKSRMDVDHVFRFPTNRYLPGTIVSYDSANDSTRVVCDPHTYIEFHNQTKDGYARKLAEPSLPTNGIILKDDSFSAELTLSASETARLGLSANQKFTGKVVLTNGKIFQSTMDFGRIMLDAAAPRNKNCAASIHSSQNPTVRYYVLRETFQYDISHTFTSADHALLNVATQKALQAEFNAKLGLDASTILNGNGLVFAATWEEIKPQNRPRCQPPLAGPYNIKVDLECNGNTAANKSTPAGENGIIWPNSLGRMAGQIKLINTVPKCDSLQGRAYVTITSNLDGRPTVIYKSQQVSPAVSYPRIILDIDEDALESHRQIWLFGQLQRTGADELTFDYDIGLACN